MKHTKEVSKTMARLKTAPKHACADECKSYLKNGDFRIYLDCLVKGPPPSDRRLKRNIRGLRGSLAKLLSLRGVSFEYNELGRERGCAAGERPGFIAQEVEEVMPQWVQYDGDGYRRLAIEGFEGLVVEALRELKTENDRLRADLEDLEERVTAMRNEQLATAAVL